MAVQSKPFTFFNNTTADANEVNADMDVLYALQAGALDSANLNMAATYQFQALVIAGLAADPASPISAQFWSRSDLGGAVFYKGAAVQHVDLDDDVNFATFLDHFTGINISDAWNGHSTTSGTASKPTAAASEYDLNTGVTSGGAYLLDFFNSTLFAVGNNANLPVFYSSRVKMRVALTNILARWGMATDGSVTFGNNSFYFEFDPATDSHFRCVSKNGATAQSTNTTVTPVVDTYNDFEIIFKSGSVQFLIDGVVVATHSTQVPASAPIGPSNYITTTNTTSKTLRLDKVKVKCARV